MSTVVLVIDLQRAGTSNELNVCLVTLSLTWSWAVLQAHELGIGFAVEGLQHSLEGLLTHRFWAPRRVSDSGCLRWSLRMFISEMFPGDADPARLGTSTENIWEPTLYDQPGLRTLEAPMTRRMLCVHFGHALSVQKLSTTQIYTFWSYTGVLLLITY